MLAKIIVTIRIVVIYSIKLQSAKLVGRLFEIYLDPCMRIVRGIPYHSNSKIAGESLTYWVFVWNNKGLNSGSGIS